LEFLIKVKYRILKSPNLFVCTIIEECPAVVQTSVFQMKIPPFFTVNYLSDHFFENIDVSNSNFKIRIF